MKTIAIFLLFSGLIVCSVQAQKKNLNTSLKSFPKEHVDLIANSELLMSGQVLYYSVSSSSELNVETISDIVYVELVSDKKESIFRHKLNLENAKAYGDFFIPASLKTGHYKIVAYTRWSLNNPQKPYDQKNLYIINPYLDASENSLKNGFSENDNYVEISALSDVMPSTDKISDGLKISTDTENYKRREKVSIEIFNSLNTSSSDSYTLKVRKVEALKSDVHNPAEKSPISSNVPDYLPEMRGELIRGLVTDSKTKKPASRQYVSVSIPGEPFIYKSTMTNEKGEFYFNLYEKYILKMSFFQVISTNKEDYEITIDQSGFTYYDDLKFYALKLNSNLSQYITRNSIYNQIESAYYNLKDDQIITDSTSKSFYGEPDLVYNLDEFARFPTVKETFIEVVRGAAMRSKNDGFQFLVYNPDFPFESQYREIKPLLLLDGVQIQDEEFFVKFNAYEIKTVSLTKGIYSIGSVIYNGIIDVKLLKPNSLVISGLAIKQVEIPSPLARKEYFQQSHKQNSERIPDFRTQLLWMPVITLNSEVKTIDFYTSDVPGKYLVELMGKTATGKVIHLTSLFEVNE